MIANIKNTLDILKKYDIRPTKKLGQNFLVDVNVLRKIITAAGISKNDGVIEIGAGIGALTEALVEAAGRVLAYETDKRFIDVLKNELDKRDNLKIFAGDFLKADINDDLGWLSECERILVVSNLPYYITTPIIFKLLEEAQPISEFYLMVQKEVGARLAAAPGSKEYSSLSVFMEYKTDVEVLFEVSKHCFYPKPDVESIVVAIKKKQPAVAVRSEEKFLEFIRKIFAQKRKTLVNNINRAYGCGKDRVLEALSGSNIRPEIRAEDLNLREIRDIYADLFESPK